MQSIPQTITPHRSLRPDALQHLDESPKPYYLFAQITARTPKAIKAACTSIKTGIEGDMTGYVWTRDNHGSYAVENTKGKVYRLAIDREQQVGSCTCEAFAYNGICKHILHLDQYKDLVDAEIDRREAEALRAEREAALDPDIARAEARYAEREAARQATRAASSVDGWDELLDYMDRAA